MHSQLKSFLMTYTSVELKNNMANRSDFFNAKLPRYLKRMISMGEAAGHFTKEQAREARKAFIDAHASHVAFKLKRQAADTGGSDE